MHKLPLSTFVFLLLLSATGLAQKVDSTLESLQQIPVKYINAIDIKIDIYSNRVLDKTEKTKNHRPLSFLF